MRRATRHAKWGVAMACAFEVWSICTGKTPTISELCGRYPLLGPAVILALAVHLGRQPAPVRVVVTMPRPDLA